MSYLGDTGSVNPPEMSPCRDCWFGDLRAYPSMYGGGAGGQQCITIKGLEDLNRTLGSLGALIENIAVSLGVEVKGGRLFPERRLENGFSAKGPVEAVKEKTGMRSGESDVGGEIGNHGR